MSEISGYSVLFLTIPPLPTYPKSTTHTVYVRPHNPRIPTESDARSLFLVNVPVDSTAAHLRAVFTSLVGAGRVEDVTFEHEKKPATSTEIAALDAGHKNKKRKRGVEERKEETPELPQTRDREIRRSGSTAIVVLVDEKSVESALKAVRKLHKSGKAKGWPIWGNGTDGKVPQLGSARYISYHKLRYPDTQTLQQNVNAYMTAFNHAEEERTRLAKRQRNVPDEDGFVTVTRGGRSGPARIEDAERVRREKEEADRKKKESMGDFYRFQMRERRKAEQGELVKRFEEDRRKVEGMRARRGKFRPES